MSSDVGRHIRDKLRPVRKHGSVSMVQYCFTPTETRRLVRTDSPGRPPNKCGVLVNYIHSYRLE